MSGEGGGEVDDLPRVERRARQALEVADRPHLEPAQVHVLEPCVGEGDGARAAVHEGDSRGGDGAEVELVGSRIGALDVYDAEIRSTRVTGTKFDWINLRSSTLEDVLFEDCTIDELDLGAVTASRVAFVNCRAGSVALPHARLEDVDLRGLEMGSIANLEGLSGATLDSAQVTALAPLLAAHLGLRIEG